MRIQVLVSNDVYPPTFGLPLRVFSIARALARIATVRVTCAVGSRDRAPASERIDGVDIRRVRTYHPTLFYYLQQARLVSDYMTAEVYRVFPGPLARAWDAQADVWQIESLNLTTLLERAPEGALRVYSSQNVEAEWFERVGPPLAGRRRWVRRIEELERRAVETADVVLAVCEEDRATFLERYGAEPDKVWVVDNGFDDLRLHPPSREEREAARRAFGLGGERALVFVGSDMPHNRIAVEHLFRHVVPHLDRLEARLFLVGAVSDVFASRAEREGRGRVLTLGVVPEMAPILWASDVGLNPITVGAGSNGKLPTYLGAGLPAVTTRFGLRGFARLAPFVTVAEPEAFAEALARGVAPVAGAAAALESYTWSSIGARLGERYRERREGRAACAS